MRRILVGLGATTAIVAAIVTAGIPQVEAASRAPRPYCLDADRTHLKDCSYYTFQQCLDTARGLGGNCYENPAILWQQRLGVAEPGRKAKARGNY